MATPREMALVLKLSATLFLFTRSSPPPMPSAVPETHTSLFWHPCQLGLPCFWCTWPPSRSLEPVLTRLVVSVQPSSSTRTRAGMTIGFSGWSKGWSSTSSCLTPSRDESHSFEIKFINVKGHNFDHVKFHPRFQFVSIFLSFFVCPLDLYVRA